MNSVLCQHIYNMAKIAKYRLSIICFFIIKQLKIILFVLIFQIFNCCCVVICFHDAWKYFQEVGVVKWLLLHWLMKFHFRSKVSTLWAIMWGFLNTMNEQWKYLKLSEYSSDCSLKPSELFVIYIIAKTSYN